MFTRKNTLISLAVVAFLAGCGGGGGDSTPAAGSSTTSSTTTSTGSNGAIAATSDAKFADTMVLASDQVAGTYGGQVIGIGYTNYTSTDPTVKTTKNKPSNSANNKDKSTDAPI